MEKHIDNRKLCSMKEANYTDIKKIIGMRQITQIKKDNIGMKQKTTYQQFRMNEPNEAAVECQ
jgi:hypothetical protein